MSLPYLHEKVGEPLQGVLVHGVDDVEISDAEVHDRSSVGHRAVPFASLVDLLLRNLCLRHLHQGAVQSSTGQGRTGQYSVQDKGVEKVMVMGSCLRLERVGRITYEAASINGGKICTNTSDTKNEDTSYDATGEDKKQGRTQIIANASTTTFTTNAATNSCFNLYTAPQLLR